MSKHEVKARMIAALLGWHIDDPSRFNIWMVPAGKRPVQNWRVAGSWRHAISILKKAKPDER